MQIRTRMTIARNGAVRRRIGVVMTLLCVAGLVHELPAGRLPPWLVLLLLVGPVLATYRSSLTLDRSAGRLILWRGLLVPMWRREHELAGISQLHLSRERRGNGRHSRTYYPVQLRGPSSFSLELQAPESYEPARRLAESVARFLGMALHDDSSGKLVVRQAAHLDESLRARYRRERKTTQLPRQAAAAEARLEPLPGGGHRILLPAAGRHPAHWALLLPTAMLILFTLPGALLTPFGLGLLGLFAATTVLLMQHLARYREEITVDAGGVSLRAGGLWPSRQHMSADEIEEILAPAEPPGFARQLAEARELAATSGVDLVRLTSSLERLLRAFAPLGIGSQVVLRGDLGSLGLGRHLPESEKSWLHEALVHLLASQPDITDAVLMSRHDGRSEPGLGRLALVLSTALLALSGAWEFGLLDGLIAQLKALLR